MENTTFIVCCTVTSLKFESHMVQHVATSQMCECSIYNMAFCVKYRVRDLGWKQNILNLVKVNNLVNIWLCQIESIMLYLLIFTFKNVFARKFGIEDRHGGIHLCVTAVWGQDRVGYIEGKRLSLIPNKKRSWSCHSLGSGLWIVFLLYSIVSDPILL